MNERYRTSDLIEYIQDLCYTSDDRLKINEIRDRLLELDNLKKPKTTIKCLHCGTENCISNMPGIYYCSNCGIQI